VAGACPPGGNCVNGNLQGTRPTFGNAFGTNPYSETRATSNYNSLQVNFKHTNRYWDALLGYTWGKSLDNSSGLTDYVNPYNPKQMYGLSKYNVASYFVASYNIHPPFADWSSNKAVRAVVGNWAISGISKFATGLPVGLTDTEDYSLTGASGIDSPFYNPGKLFAGGAKGDRNPRDFNSATGGRNPFFNTSLFTKESAQCSPKINCYGLYGNAKRRFFSGPGIDATDLALMREFHIKERNVVQVRMEAFNFLNHTQFSAPQGSATSSTFGFVTAAVNPRVLQAAARYRF
jgi:hypothetical protein